MSTVANVKGWAHDYIQFRLCAVAAAGEKEIGALRDDVAESVAGLQRECGREEPHFVGLKALLSGREELLELFGAALGGGSVDAFAQPDAAGGRRGGDHLGQDQMGISNTCFDLLMLANHFCIEPVYTHQPIEPLL